MRLLLDTNIIVPLARRELERVSAPAHLLLSAGLNEVFVSAASLWEIAIKVRIGKLDTMLALERLGDFCMGLGHSLLSVTPEHAVAELDNETSTRDSFDRLLLAQCQVEGMRLVTLDRALARHPLAWRAK